MFFSDEQELNEHVSYRSPWQRNGDRPVDNRLSRIVPSTGPLKRHMRRCVLQQGETAEPHVEDQPGHEPDIKPGCESVFESFIALVKM